MEGKGLSYRKIPSVRDQPKTWNVWLKDLFLHSAKSKL